VICQSALPNGLIGPVDSFDAGLTPPVRSPRRPVIWRLTIDTEGRVRKFGILACLLASTLATNVANGQTEPAAPPANWRALVARHLLQKYDLSNIREAGLYIALGAFQYA